MIDHIKKTISIKGRHLEHGKKVVERIKATGKKSDFSKFVQSLIDKDIEKEDSEK